MEGAIGWGGSGMWVGLVGGVKSHLFSGCGSSQQRLCLWEEGRGGGVRVGRLVAHRVE